LFCHLIIYENHSEMIVSPLSSPRNNFSDFSILQYLDRSAVIVYLKTIDFQLARRASSFVEKHNRQKLLPRRGLTFYKIREKF
jgi:hypothetical protein